jgi:tetratricopeptide (TPR) repeat protein
MVPQFRYLLVFCLAAQLGGEMAFAQRGRGGGRFSPGNLGDRVAPRASIGSQPNLHRFPSSSGSNAPILRRGDATDRRWRDRALGVDGRPIGANRIGANPDRQQRSATNRQVQRPNFNAARNAIRANAVIKNAPNARQSNYLNHWNPYSHAGWHRGYWNGRNFGATAARSTAANAAVLGAANRATSGGTFYGPYGYTYSPYGYGNQGFGLYGSYPYGLNYGGYPYGYGYGPWLFGRSWGALAALGLSSWALGSNYYNLGYGSYMNPYYSPAMAGYNYAQPIAVSYIEDQPAVETTKTAQAQAAELLDSARANFRDGQYEQALQALNQAIDQAPDDLVLHEFRALVLFALGRYEDAAAGVYAVLSVAPGWNWSTLISFYPSVALYTDQLRALEEQVVAQPENAGLRFLVGYHYLTEGHNEAALKQFQAAAKLKPEDSVSRQLVGVLEQTIANKGEQPVAVKEQPVDSNAPPQPEADETAKASSEKEPVAKPAEDQAEQESPKLVGDWKAKGQQDDQVELDLKDDQTFVWQVTHDGKTEKHPGKYEQHGDILVLDFDEGGGMAGTVKTDDSGFQFRVLHAPDSDPGLNFNAA